VRTIRSQLTWQLKTKVRLTISYSLDVTRSEHLHKNLLTTKSKELRLLRYVVITLMYIGRGEFQADEDDRPNVADQQSESTRRD